MLRNRTLLEVTPPILLLVVISGSAVWLCERPGNVVNTPGPGNDTGTVAMCDLKDQAMRIDQAFLTYRTGGTTLPQTRSVVEDESTQDRHRVDAELTIITEPGEHTADDRLKAKDESFLTTVTAALSQRLDAEAKLSSTLGSLLDAASEILGIDQRAMTQQEQRARKTARQSTRVMLVP